MNINTDLIKNKKFNGAISNDIVNVSQEYRVLAILRYLFPDKYEQMKKREKPDLQDEINHIGIEVTSAVQENDMKANRAFAELDKTSNKNRKNNIKKISESGYEIHNTNGILSISKCESTDLEKDCLQNAIFKKCGKYDTYKKNFKTIGLAVLLPEIPTSYAEDHIIDWIKEIHSSMKTSFDIIYVISSRFCIICDIKNDYMDKKCLKNMENELLCKIARMTAEGELTLDSIEWN